MPGGCSAGRQLPAGVMPGIVTMHRDALLHISQVFLIRLTRMLFYILGVQLCFRRFFSEIRGFIVKNWLYIYDSKYCPSLATTFSHLSGSVRIPR